MWWNRRFTSWMCSRQICSNCVMLSCQYGLKSLRNVSNTLLNLCHEELRQFWKQKCVQPGTSKVYLIKCPVRVYYVAALILHANIAEITAQLLPLSYVYLISSDDGWIIRIFVQINIFEVRTGCVVLMGHVSVTISYSDNRNSKTYQRKQFFSNN